MIVPPAPVWSTTSHGPPPVAPPPPRAANSRASPRGVEAGPFTTRPWRSIIDTPRGCARCGKSLEGKRPHAKYCTRSCKTLAANQRRIERDPDYDRRRYAEVEAETRRASARRYYANNREQQALYTRNYTHANRAKRAAQEARRKALIEASDPINITAKEWRRLKAHHRNACAYCRRPCTSLQMDHVVPLARGGRHAPANILPACPTCNISKRDHLLTEWRLRVLKGGEPHLFQHNRV